MITYPKIIIITTAVCQIMLIMAGELWGDHAKKTLRFLCGMVMLLTLFSPVKGFMEMIESTMTKILQETETEIENPVVYSSSAMEVAYDYVSEKWFSFLTEEYDLERSQIVLCFETDTENNILEAEITLKECPYALRRKIERELKTSTDIPITVKGK